MGSKIKNTRAFIRARYIKNEIKRDIKFYFANNKNHNDKKKIYIFLAADYGNLGDIAITYAQKNFIKSHVNSNCEIIEVPLSCTYEEIKIIKKVIKRDDIVTIIGGGNMGDRYDWIEEARRTVIKKFKNNKIISFPQTFEFNDDNIGKESLRRTRKVYYKHKDITLFAREEMSYKKMKETLKNKNIYLVPDIVISLKNKLNIIENNRKNKIGVCLRNDNEKSLSFEQQKEVLKFIEKEDLEYFDTHIGDENLIYSERYDKLIEFLQGMSKMKLVITDRLHGMIFCYLTNTPCLVIDNSNHKISATYNTWLKRCNYIKTFSKDNLDNLLNELKCMKDYNFYKNFEKLGESFYE